MGVFLVFKGDRALQRIERIEGIEAQFEVVKLIT